MAEIKTLAVIGAGELGRSIACASALAGYRTVLEDILPASLRRADRQIRDFLEQSIESGKVSRQEAEAALARLEYAGTVEEAARQADLVIEAVPDEMESKLEIFTLLDRIAKPHTILVCTSTTLRISDIAAITFRSEKVLGLKFSSWASETDPLAIVRHISTNEDTISTCITFIGRMGRNPVLIEEA